MPGRQTWNKAHQAVVCVPLLPRLRLEVQARRVFGYGSLDLVGGAVGKVRRNLDGHFDVRVGIRAQD